MAHRKHQVTLIIKLEESNNTENIGCVGSVQNWTGLITQELGCKQLYAQRLAKG